MAAHPVPLHESVEITIFFDEDPETKLQIGHGDVRTFLSTVYQVLISKIASTYHRSPHQPDSHDLNRIRIVALKAKHDNELHQCLELIDGTVAIELLVSARDVWNQIAVLQDQIYNPESELTGWIRSQRLKLHPCRAFVKEARVSFGSVAELDKYEANHRLAAIAARQSFLRIAKMEITTREALADCYIKAEASKVQMDKISHMFDEVTASTSDPAQIKKALAVLKQSHAKVQETSRLVAYGSEKAIEYHNLAEQAKLAAYFCAARTGITESYQEWSRREFIFSYLPKNLLPDSLKSKFADEREKSIQYEIRAEMAKTKLTLVEEELKKYEASQQYGPDYQTEHLIRLRDEAQRIVTEERERATLASNAAIQLYKDGLKDGGKASTVPPVSPSPPSPSHAASSHAASSHAASSHAVSKVPPKGSALYMCSLGTGFIGTYEEVDAHEKKILAQRQGLSAPTSGSNRFTSPLLTENIFVS
mmetsp:Transcript_80961/g.217158  ORF Transcript_80961/g.217158 Transcript_80961/m.217158 type:complete len:478 (+) Transcript_80961:38-1471(+)